MDLSESSFQHLQCRPQARKTSFGPGPGGSGRGQEGSPDGGQASVFIRHRQTQLPPVARHHVDQIHVREQFWALPEWTFQRDGILYPMSGPNFREIDQPDLILFVAENIPQVSVSVYPAFDGPVPPGRNRFVVELGQGVKRIPPRLGQIFREGLQGLSGLLDLLWPAGRGRTLLHREWSAGFLKPDESFTRLRNGLRIWILMQGVALDSLHHNPGKIDVPDGVTNREQFRGEIWITRLSNSLMPPSFPCFDGQFHHPVALVLRPLHPSGRGTTVLPDRSKGHEVRECLLVL